MRRNKMKKYYNTPELEVTKFDFEQQILTAGNPTDPGNIITNPFTTSDPDETATVPPWVPPTGTRRPR